MLAKNKISDVETGQTESVDEVPDSVQTGKSTTSWRIRGIETSVRDAAKEAAKIQDVKLSDFVTDAILQHIERLENTEENAESDMTHSLTVCIARIEALENRLAQLETPDIHRTKLMAHKRVRNLVERPWLKNRNYL